MKYCYRLMRLNGNLSFVKTESRKILDKDGFSFHLIHDKHWWIIDEITGMGVARGKTQKTCIEYFDSLSNYSINSARLVNMMSMPNEIIYNIKDYIKFVDERYQDSNNISLHYYINNLIEDYLTKT